MKKVLTFRASSMGDALMGKYFLENVHRAFPEALCGLLVGSRGEMISELLAGYPWLRVVQVNRRSPLSVAKLFKNWYPLDLAVTQYAEKPFSMPSKVVARILSRKLVGFDDGWRFNSLFYDSILPFPGEKKSAGMITEEQKALKAAGIGVLVRNLSLAYQKDAGTLERFGLLERGYIVLHLFSGNEGRSMSQKKRRAITRVINESFGNDFTVVLTGGNSDKKRAEEAGEGGNARILAGETSMTELINLVAGARAIVSLDTGVAHIAAHLGKPLVVLTRCAAKSAWWSDAMYGGVPVVLCREDMCGTEHKNGNYPPCLEMIDTAKVIRGVMRMISE